VLRAEPSGSHDDTTWDHFVASHPHGHLLQTSAWGRFRANWGWNLKRFVVRDGSGNLIAGVQAQVRATPLGRLTYVPRGPVCRPGDPAWQVLLEALEHESQAGLALRLEPNWPDAPPSRSFLRQEGLVEAEPVQPPSTICLDLAASEEELLAGMKQKWRYNIRLAARRGVRIVEGASADMERFGALMAVTGERDGFGSRPPSYFADAKAAFGDSCHLYVAERGGEMLAGVMVFHCCRSATYLYGASSNSGRRHMPNHLLQWEAIRRAKADGLLSYDFWGIPDAVGRAAVTGTDPDEVPRGQGGLWGVWGFKRGFGGSVCRSVGAWDLVQSPIRYRLARLADLVRRRLVSRG
jgi:lipid II:glycine glycyltransferase (peptidoglycan interpeptide bridge formation enzyme)